MSLGKQMRGFNLAVVLCAFTLGGPVLAEELEVPQTQLQYQVASPQPPPLTTEQEIAQTEARIQELEVQVPVLRAKIDETRAADESTLRDYAQTATRYGTGSPEANAARATHDAAVRARDEAQDAYSRAHGDLQGLRQRVVLLKETLPQHRFRDADAFETGRFFGALFGQPLDSRDLQSPGIGTSTETTPQPSDENTIIGDQWRRRLQYGHDELLNSPYPGNWITNRSDVPVEVIFKTRGGSRTQIPEFGPGLSTGIPRDVAQISIRPVGEGRLSVTIDNSRFETVETITTPGTYDNPPENPSDAFEKTDAFSTPMRMTPGAGAKSRDLGIPTGVIQPISPGEPGED